MIHGGNVWQGDNPAEWLDYSANIRPEGPPEWVKAALKGAVDKVAYYPDPQMRRAKKAMADYLAISEQYVQPTAGGISAIRMANGLKNTETVIFTPCFCEYEQYASAPVRKISLLKKKHEIAIPEDLQICQGSLVWLCNPLNPTGTVFSKEIIMELLKKTEAADGWLVVDEAFIEYAPRYSSIDLLKTHERLLITGSMTKILGVPGVRLGYLCAHPQTLEKLKRYQLTWELSCFAEAIACEIPEHREDILQDSRKNAARREAMKRALEKMGIFVYPGDAAFLLLDLGRDAEPVRRYLYEKRILVRDCINFDGVNDGQHLRVAVKDEMDNRIFLKILEEAMICAESH